MSEGITGKPTSTERVKYLHSHLQGMMHFRPLLVPNEHNMTLSHSPSHTHTGIHPSLNLGFKRSFTPLLTATALTVLRNNTPLLYDSSCFAITFPVCCLVGSVVCPFYKSFLLFTTPPRLPSALTPWTKSYAVISFHN